MAAAKNVETILQGHHVILKMRFKEQYENMQDLITWSFLNIQG
jgi:hypothetical protein